MDKTVQIDMLRALSDANGVSGFEEDVVALVRELGAGLGEFEQDPMLNLMLQREGNTGAKPVVLLDAHTDEVGFMVQSITAGGLLRFIPLGGWVNCNIPAHMVRVRTADGAYIPGIVASKPPHFLSEAERKAAPGIEAMLIDVGASSREEAEGVFGIRVGAPVVPEAPFIVNGKNDTLMGKAFDCRAGVAALLAAMQELHGDTLDVDVVAAFSVQEELGLRGSKVTSRRARPDVAIVLEGCPADDTFAAEGQCVLHKGPMLRHIDSTILTNPRLMRLVLEVAGELEIPVQQAVRSGGGTNAGAIHLAGEGVPVIVIGLPVRYIHTHNGIMAYDDYEAAVKLAVGLVRRLARESIGRL